ncbi:GMC oxidoreductase [Kocuria sp. NPDC057446]|uniref:GMC oxidoreductase n=1 Tax=Kocuria sp. NPDC057446 TaxID=3346137 RepID=UPI003698FAE2
MGFHPSQYRGLIAADSEVQRRFFTQYQGTRDDFDVIVIGSGIGGGLLADDLVEHVDSAKGAPRVLVLEAGSYLFPTHVYNTSRFDNAEIARSFACQTFWQPGGFADQRYIHEAPQLNLGGRSVFWSGLIPTIQPWELEFFPDGVREALTDPVVAVPGTTINRLEAAGRTMNESATMGSKAEELVDHLRRTELGDDFEIHQTPRALHQPYLVDRGTSQEKYFVEPTGVFNTAELLINQLGRDRDHNGSGLHLQLNQYVEDIQRLPSNWLRLVSRSTLTGRSRSYYAPRVVLAGGSIESPRLLMRSALGRSLDEAVRNGIGKGLTDHPTTDSRAALVTRCRGTTLEIPRNEHAKIIFYPRNDGGDQDVQHPFNVELNINHEYWHRRDNDPDTRDLQPPGAASVLDFKFSFANCLDPGNAVHPAPPGEYVSQIDFSNLNWTSHTVSRIERLTGRNMQNIFAELNGVGTRILDQFEYCGDPPPPGYAVRNTGEVPTTAPLGHDGKGFGRGTVHHAAGTLAMPYRPARGEGITSDSVVDEDLQVRGADGLYVCDMSVMPFSSAANPVRVLAALALRLSEHLFSRWKDQ